MTPRDTVAQRARSHRIERALDRVADGHPVSRNEAIALMGARGQQLDRLCAIAASSRDDGLVRRGTPRTLTYSRKVFVPLTTLCRDRCHYCVFVDTPNQLQRAQRPVFQPPEAVLEIARAGAAAGCREVLFTLGDRPEARWPVAEHWLRNRGYRSTLDYVVAMAELVRTETGLLPHLNPGVMTWAELERMRTVAPSVGMMLETTSRTLWEQPGSAHYGSPDKEPTLRLRVLEDAGRARIPFSTGILLGIGEELADRVDSLFAIRESHDRWGHIQETIVQNFRAKPATAMRGVPDFGAAEYRAAVAVARLVLGPVARIQVPPNLSDEAELEALMCAGIDDWGGVSPVTPDHVNPERPWPDLDRLTELTRAAGYHLRERLTAHAEYLDPGAGWIDERLRADVDRHRVRAGIRADPLAPPPVDLWRPQRPGSGGPSHTTLLRRAEEDPGGLSESDASRLLTAEGADLLRLTGLADELRAEHAPDLTFVRNRVFPLHAFTRSDRAALAEAATKAEHEGFTEAAVLGLPENGPSGELLLVALKTMHEAAPGLHLHGCRPREISGGARSLGLSFEEFLSRLVRAGLRTVAGTGLPTSDSSDAHAQRWFRRLLATHRTGISSTVAFRYGDATTPRSLVRLLRTIQRVHRDRNGFTEVIPMPVGPGGDRARASRGFEDRARAVTALTRLLLGAEIPHVQAAWPDLGLGTARAALRSGADDHGGTLGVAWGVSPAQRNELTEEALWEQADRLGRSLRQRDTRYRSVTETATSEAPHRARPLPETLP